VGKGVCFDTGGLDLKRREGPEGGEAAGMRALYSYIRQRYARSRFDESLPCGRDGCFAR